MARKTSSTAAQASSAVIGLSQLALSSDLSVKANSASSIVRLSSLREYVAGALTIEFAKSGARIGSTSPKPLHAVGLVVPTFQPACAPSAPGFAIMPAWMACTWPGGRGVSTNGAEDDRASK